MNYCALWLVGGFLLGFWVCAALKIGNPADYSEDTEPVYLTDSMIDALNKDEPRRAYLGYRDAYIDNQKVWYCPRCFCELCKEDDEGSVAYCSECGQHIDWG